MKTRLLLPVMAVVCAVVTFGCKKESTGQAGDVIKIGEFASLTGKEAAFGQSSHKGTLLAIEDINAAGGVLGKKINFIYEDNRSTPGESATIVKKLITRDHVVAVLGEVASGRSLEAGPICQANKIPQISPSSTNPKVTETGDYIFRVCFIDPFQGYVMARFATDPKEKQGLGLKKMAILVDQRQAYSQGLAKNFEEALAKVGGQVVAKESYQ